MTDDVDRMAIIAELRDLVDAPPPLAPHEFTASDFREMYNFEEAKGYRELRKLVGAGILAGGDKDRDARYDPRTKRRVTAYWRAEQSQ